MMRTKVRKHKDYLWSSIYELRNSVMEDVMSKGGFQLETILRKKALILKYSKRLRLMEMK